ncbi:MAG: hypothetical protein CM1200mP13_17710 [Candidatus Pelagibacterales bacterium]|nr:MAG: hypothetical protein CM1200mP13_17710 [Pelagibacterales bacterium]
MKLIDALIKSKDNFYKFNLNCICTLIETSLSDEISHSLFASFNLKE